MLTPGEAGGVAASVAAFAVLGFEMRKSTSQMRRELDALLSAGPVSNGDLADAEQMIGYWTELRARPAVDSDDDIRAGFAGRIVQLNARLEARELLREARIGRTSGRL